MINQKNIGEFLRSLRKEKQLTQEQLAERLNVSSRTVSRWETGSNLPDLSLLIELAQFYDVDITEIINAERKDGKMEEQLKNTLTQVAQYEDTQKAQLVKRVRIIDYFGLFFGITAIVLTAGNFYENSIILSLLNCMCIGFATGTILKNILFFTGVLEKVNGNKRTKLLWKIIGIVCFVFAIFCAVMAFIFER